MKLIRLFSLILAVAFLSSCAAGKWFMSGYTPPETIADLINEQELLAGGVDLGNRSNKGIELNSYRGKSTGRLGLGDEVIVQRDVLASRFRPSFTHKGLEDYASQLSMKLVRNAIGLSPDAVIAVTSFVKLDYSLQNTTVLGNQLAEMSITNLQGMGLRVADFKLMPAIQVGKTGDLAFSRELTSLANQHAMDHILSGTMIEKKEGVFINARIMTLSNSRVVSSASVFVPNFLREKEFQYRSNAD